MIITQIAGIGIGAPNASKNGTIETPANLKVERTIES